MGSVWRAEHLTLHTEVAVKFVSDALIGDAGFLARFTREAVASAQIKSPHAVQIFDHGVTADGQPYIVLELLEGEDLRTRLLRERKVPLADAVKIVTQVARGLSRAHAAEIVHRDIKPGNIFLLEQDGDLFVKILDFGIAKRIGDVDSGVTMTGQIIGTPHYVSPEQIQRPREADPQSDLWSLAVVAYRCLTGDLPFEGESVGAVSIAIDRAKFVPVTEREPALPKMLDVWFSKAFARASSARFGSVKELALAFDAASRDEALPSGPPDSAVLSLRNATPAPLAQVAWSPAANDTTPGTVDLGAGGAEGAGGAAGAGVTGGAAVSAGDERATRPDVAEIVASAETALLATETPRKADTPMTMGEPTLSQGTVTHIEATHPRRTKLYGGLLAGLAIGGALTVGLLSRGDEPATGSPGSAGVSVTAPSTAPTAESAMGVTAATAMTATSTGSSAASVAASQGTGATTPSGPGGAATVATSAVAPSKSAAPAASGTSTKKKKDRGF